MANTSIRSGVCRLVAAAALALSAQAAVAQAVPDAWPDWLKDAMGRETSGLDGQAVSLGDGAFRSRLPARSLTDAQPIEDGWYFTGDIESQGMLECWVFTTSVDPATLIANITEVSMQATADANGPIATQTIYYTGVGLVGDKPYLALEWLYGVGEAPNMLLGLSKARVTWIGQNTIACGHNDLGYRDTFESAFETFADAAVFANAGNPPVYEEVFVHRIGDRDVGLSHMRFSIDADGDTEMRSVESTLLPVDGSTLNVSDAWTVAYTRPDGSLINQVNAATENGELVTNLNLARGEDGAWLVSGTFQGKEVAGEMDADAEPLADIAQMHAVAELFEDDERDSISFLAWVPDADPLNFMTAAATLDADSKDGSGAITLGPINLDTLFDQNGSVRQASMNLGGVTMTIDRVRQQGELP